jgi:hypothetical protein
VLNTLAERSHQSHSRQSCNARASRQDAYPLSPTGARSGRSTQTGRSRDGSQTVSAGIHFAKGSKISSKDGCIDSKPYSHIDIDTYINAYHTDNNGIQTIPEIDFSPVGQNEFGLSPLNTRSESDLGEALAMMDIKAIKGVENTASLLSSPVAPRDEEDDSSGCGGGTQAYKSASATTSAASVGVRASVSAAIVGRGSIGVYSMKDLDLDLV